MVNETVLQILNWVPSIGASLLTVYGIVTAEGEALEKFRNNGLLFFSALILIISKILNAMGKSESDESQAGAVMDIVGVILLLVTVVFSLVVEKGKFLTSIVGDDNKMGRVLLLTVAMMSCYSAGITTAENL